MTMIKIIILAVTLLFLILYPILQKTKTNRMLREIERRDEARRLRNRLREQNENDDEVFRELRRRREEFESQMARRWTRLQRQDEPQEEFLTEKDFQL